MPKHMEEAGWFTFVEDISQDPDVVDSEVVERRNINSQLSN